LHLDVVTIQSFKFGSKQNYFPSINLFPGIMKPHIHFNRLLSLTVALFCFSTLYSQNTLRINYTDGSNQDISLDKIQDITFIDVSDEPGALVSLTGSWVWGRTTSGYYEVITFNADGTYVGNDCYFEYGFNTQTYGTYKHSGIMLNLWSNGYGYQRWYRWFVTNLTSNALEVMTPNGPFVYYRLEEEVLRLKAGGSPLDYGSEKQFVFADGVTAKIEDGKLYGLASGSTYVELMNNATNTTKAYLVVVE